MDAQQQEKTYYSKTELEEFRQLIMEKLADATAEERRLLDALREFSGGSVDPINITEYGNEGREKEQIEILMARQGKFMHSLEKALVRIENGTYGICRNTGKLIPKERLRIVPHATTTVEGKMQEQSAIASPYNTQV
jgi:RNA polymerase-binding transcription factor DksA